MSLSILILVFLHALDDHKLFCPGGDGHTRRPSHRFGPNRPLLIGNHCQRRPQQRRQSGGAPKLAQRTGRFADRHGIAGPPGTKNRIAYYFITIQGVF